MDSKFDVVICVGAKDVFIVQMNIIKIFKCFDVDKIYLISKKAYRFMFRSLLLRYDTIQFIDEDSVLEGLSFKELTDFIELHKPHLKTKIGWYFQQFLKIGFSRSKYCCRNYLIWDADTIPVRKIRFFEGGKVQFCPKTEYHRPYFVTISELLSLSKIADFSFIAEHIMVIPHIMCEMLDAIEKNKEIEGNSYWEKIISSIKSGTLLGFSEFETYGTYFIKNYPDLYAIRELSTCRNAGKIYGRYITMKELNNIGEYDTISLEPADKPRWHRQISQLPQRIMIKIISLLF